MKKYGFAYTTFAVTCLLLQAGLASIIVEDDFSTYSDGNLNGQSGSPTGLSGTWSASDSTISGSTLHMADSTGDGIQLSRGIAANTAIPADGNSVYAAITFTTHGTIDANDSFAFQINPTAAPTFWSFGFQNSTFSLNGGGLSGSIAAETTYTLISRLTRNDAGNDSVTLWLNPTSELNSPLLSATENYLVSGETSLASIVLEQAENNGDTLDITRMAVGTTFDDVVAVPEPSAWGLLFLGAVCFSLRRNRAN